MRTANASAAKVFSATLLLLAVPLLFWGCRPDSDKEIVVFAAASLRDVLQEMSGELATATGLKPIFNFAGSNVLAHQVAASSVADVFLSASDDWVDYLQTKGMLLESSRRVFLSNRLVIVAHADSSFELKRPQDLALLPFRFLSIGDPRAVPAGQYARAFLGSVRDGGGTLWEKLEGRLVPAPDVRGALALVEARPDVIGIVYQSDARASRRVRVLMTVAETLHPPIRYSAVQLKTAKNRRGGEAFIEFLETPAAGRRFEAHGFRPVGGGTSG